MEYFYRKSRENKNGGKFAENKNGGKFPENSVWIQGFSGSFPTEHCFRKWYCGIFVVI
jgi:hypothetical protein